jgi:predicted Zn-dependent protease
MKMFELALKLIEIEKPEYYELRYQEEKGNYYLFKNGKLEGISTVCERGIGVRILTSGTFGFGSTNI